MSKLSKRARVILMHRLDASDAVAEALDLPENHPAFAEAREALESGSLDGLKSAEAVEILKDCAEGSTYFAGAEDAVALGEISKGSLMADHKAANEIERALGVVVPRA